MAKKRTKVVARRGSPAARGSMELLVGTTKGAFRLRGGARGPWSVEGPWQLGSKVHDFVADPRSPRTLLMTVAGGHLGPTVLRSTDGGRSWSESSAPPKFAPLAKKAKKPGDDGTSRGLSVKYNVWLSPGHRDERSTWYLGSNPQGLFASDDHGDTWRGIDGFNLSKTYFAWTGGPDGTPDGSMLHSVLVDPRDAAHLYLSMSSGGTFESRDRGATWRPLNRGVFVDFGPVPYPETGQDPHCVVLSPSDPDRLWQQNHCGVYRLDRGAEGDAGEVWTRVGLKLPKAVGDIGFPIVAHPTDRDCAWVFPMDGTRLWPRTSPGGKPAVYRTENAGRTWQRLDRGFPAGQAFLTVKRQGMCLASDDGARSSALALGTTGGELWLGTGDGESWRCVARHLPSVQSVRRAGAG